MPPVPMPETFDRHLALLFTIALLTPAERMVLLLRKVFGYDLTEIACLVGENEANCSRKARRTKRSIAALRCESAFERKEDPE